MEFPRLELFVVMRRRASDLRSKIPLAVMAALLWTAAQALTCPLAFHGNAMNGRTVTGLSLFSEASPNRNDGEKERLP